MIIFGEIKKGVNFNLDDLSETIKVKKNSILRMFKTLEEKGLIEYQPPFRELRLGY